jgi:hypothetical protein
LIPYQSGKALNHLEKNCKANVALNYIAARAPRLHHLFFDSCAIIRKIINKYIAYYCAILYNPLLLIKRGKHVVVSAKPKIRK